MYICWFLERVHFPWQGSFQLYCVCLRVCLCFFRFAYNVFCLRLWIATCPERRFAVKAGSLLVWSCNLIIFHVERGMVFIPFVLREGGEED